MDFAPFLEDFLSYLKGVKNYSNNTLRAYSSDLTCYIEHLNGDQPSCKSQRQYLYILRQKGLSPTTIKRRVAVIKSFNAFLLRNFQMDILGIECLESPKCQRTIPDYLSEDEILLLLDPANHRSSVAGYRNIAILEMLYSTGARVSEICDMKEKDVYFSEGKVKIYGKGQKDRFAPLTLKCSLCVKEYMERKEESEYLFISTSGRKLRRETIYVMIKKLAKKIGIEKNISPHTLRHSFATHMLNQGVNLRMVQYLLGHRHISTTEIYLHVTQEAINQAIRMHPRS